MIFPVLETEDVVQVGDKTRLDASKCFISKDEADITLVEILPEAGGDYVDVTGATSDDWFLDWVYTGATRTVTVTVRVTTDGSPTTLSKTISIVTAADDKLFSGDQDLVAREPDILKWVSQGRASFLNVHRAAQVKILEDLDEAGVVDVEGAKLTKAAVVDTTEVRAWSRDLTLSMIYLGLSNAVDDVFERKGKYYLGEAGKRKQRAVIRLDLNGDGEIDASAESVEGVQFKSMELVRR